MRELAVLGRKKLQVSIGNLSRPEVAGQRGCLECS